MSRGSRHLSFGACSNARSAATSYYGAPDPLRERRAAPSGASMSGTAHRDLGARCRAAAPAAPRGRSRVHVVADPRRRRRRRDPLLRQPDPELPAQRLGLPPRRRPGGFASRCRRRQESAGTTGPDGAMDHSIPDSMICCVRTPHPSLVAAWLTAPVLRGRPLILGGLAHERASVTTASTEARAQGVVEGMSLNQAQQFAPHAIFQAVDEEATARVRQSLLLTLHHFTPDVAAGEDPCSCAFLRLDRLALRWPDRSRLLAAISRAIDAAIRVRPTIGVASSMFVSAVAAAHATTAVPLVVEQEKTRAFLARYPIDVLPLDDDLREYLELLGIKTIGRLQAISRPAFRRQFGQKALEIYDLAVGDDRRRLRPWRPAVRIEESEPLEPAVDNTQALQFIARALAERVNESLLAQGLRTRAIRIKLDQESAPALMIEAC